MSMNAHIGFIGAGNMATALLGGMLNKGITASQISLSDVNESALNKLYKDFGVSTYSDNRQLIEQSDIIILAVKPQVMQSVLEDLQTALQDKQCLLISIAAGITVKALNTWSGGSLPIIRCMPNTPSLVSLGASALYANEAVKNSQKQHAETILSSVGIVEWLDSEEKIDAVTALSGSGPAYFFLMLEAMIDTAVEQGLPRETAQNLAIQTALGAASMAQQSDVDLTELRKRVTSPGGTTEAAINNFEANHFRSIIKDALNAAKHRSIELSGE